MRNKKIIDLLFFIMYNKFKFRPVRAKCRKVYLLKKKHYFLIKESGAFSYLSSTQKPAVPKPKATKKKSKKRKKKEIPCAGQSLGIHFFWMNVLLHKLKASLSSTADLMVDLVLRQFIVRQ